jgi:hypothetical protein
MSGLTNGSDPKPTLEDDDAHRSGSMDPGIHLATFLTAAHTERLSAASTSSPCGNTSAAS